MHAYVACLWVVSPAVPGFLVSLLSHVGLPVVPCGPPCRPMWPPCRPMWASLFSHVGLPVVPCRPPSPVHSRKSHSNTVYSTTGTRMPAGTTWSRIWNHGGKSACLLLISWTPSPPCMTHWPPLRCSKRVWSWLLYATTASSGLATSPSTADPWP